MSQDPAVYASARAAFFGGVREAFGTPAFVLMAGMVGFGALARESGFSVWLALATSGFIWALPGQVVLVEMFAVGASLVAIVLAVSFTATRFLPMTMTLVPQLHVERSRKRLYAVAQLIAMTTWAGMMRRAPSLPPERRLAFFTGFSLMCWGVSIPGTALGFFSTGHVPAAVTLGMVFLNPLFFLLLFAEVRQRSSQLALAIGAVAGPSIHFLSPGWTLLACGIGGGTLAFFIGRAWRHRGR